MAETLREAARKEALVNHTKVCESEAKDAKAAPHLAADQAETATQQQQLEAVERGEKTPRHKDRYETKTSDGDCWSWCTTTTWAPSYWSHGD